MHLSFIIFLLSWSLSRRSSKNIGCNPYCSANSWGTRSIAVFPFRTLLAGPCYFECFSCMCYRSIPIFSRIAPFRIGRVDFHWRGTFPGLKRTGPRIVFRSRSQAACIRSEPFHTPSATAPCTTYLFLLDAYTSPILSSDLDVPNPCAIRHIDSIVTPFLAATLKDRERWRYFKS